MFAVVQMLTGYLVKWMCSSTFFFHFTLPVVVCTIKLANEKSFYYRESQLYLKITKFH